MSAVVSAKSHLLNALELNFHPAFSYQAGSSNAITVAKYDRHSSIDGKRGLGVKKMQMVQIHGQTDRNSMVARHARCPDETLKRIVDAFNVSQNDYVVVETSKGNYLYFLFILSYK